MGLQLRSAMLDDLDTLTDMNQQLIEDEGSPNPMSWIELRRRMQAWLQDSSWHADLLVREEDGEIIGYALYHFKKNPYFPIMDEVYLRQYFIKRDYRKQGFGLEGIQRLKESRFVGVDTIEIDVLESNSRGRSFWMKAGFQPYVINMRMQVGGE